MGNFPVLFMLFTSLLRCSSFSRSLALSMSEICAKRIRKTVSNKKGPEVGLAKSVDRSRVMTDAKSILFPEFASSLSGLPDLSKPFTVLGIETSCDDTGVAIIRSDGEILGEYVSSQHNIHENWGGVVPGLAREAHLLAIDCAIDDALSQAKLSSVADVDAVAVTVGPGLEICLRVGCEKAKKLAAFYKRPFVSVHHLEAHVMLARAPLSIDGKLLVESASVDFPFLSLLVSGGHCQLLLCEDVGKFKVLGGTVDDALGEAYDKVARILGLPIGGGGGPSVELAALNGDPKSVKLPVPMLHKRNMDFSFAGLKNSFRRSVELYRFEQKLGNNDPLPAKKVSDFAASFQNVAVRHLEQRLSLAMDYCDRRGVKTLALVGGVAANKEIRRRIGALCEQRVKSWNLVIPPIRLCTDNGVMTAWCGVERLRKGMSNQIEGQEVYPRVPLGPPAT